MSRFRPFCRLLFAVAVMLLYAASTQAAGRAFYVATVADPIGPGIADFIVQGVEKAEKNEAGCFILQLDTPGGLVESMRDIVSAFLNTEVPVVVYVSPQGARAASAGAFIVISADIAAMAPGTHIGAAHPVAAGGKEMDETLSDKIVNDLAALAKTVAEKRGRNIQWAEKAVRESVSVTETEALEKNVIDLTATDINDLIRQINGLNVAGKGILRLDASRRVNVKETLRTKVLKIISDPNIAYILLMLGLAGIYFELANPGAVLPGVVGGISLILAFFALQTLPVDVAGVLLILAALVFFLLEIKIASYGMLSLAGVASFLLGSLMLFETPSQLEVSLSVVLPTALLACGFFVVVAALVFKAQRAKPTTGSGGLVGEIGVARTDINPSGKVFVHGELWRAVTDNPVKNGEPVRVIAVNRLVLTVTPMQKDEITHKEDR